MSSMTKEEKQNLLKSLRTKIKLFLWTPILFFVVWKSLEYFNRFDKYHLHDCLLFQNEDIYLIDAVAEYQSTFHVILIHKAFASFRNEGEKFLMTHEQFEENHAKKVTCPAQNP